MMNGFVWKYRLTAILLLLAAIFQPSAAKEDKEYNVRKVSVDLRKDADAVVRKKITRLEVKKASKAVLKVTSAVTVYNENGRSHGHLWLWYDSRSKISELKGRIYDSEGGEVKELESENIKDYKGTDAISLCDDYRVKIAELYYHKYPYTVEFQYEITLTSFVSLNTWYSRLSIDPVEYSRYELYEYDTSQIKIWCNRDSVKPKVTYDGKEAEFVWEEKNLPLLPKDIYGDDLEDISTVVKATPMNFEVEDYKGATTSWKEVGLWNIKLWQGRDELPIEAAAEVRALTDSISDPRAKIAKIYRYMQDRTRYISIQLGIGGYQPMKAMAVHEKGYGDCKALSNYTIALLKAVGINAYPVLINSGNLRYPFIAEFPSQLFNHVLVAVPLQTDTVFLECTNSVLPAGCISKYTQNRKALLLKPEGGEVISMPVTTAAQNLQLRTAEVTLSSRGNADAAVCIKWTGQARDRINEMLENNSPEDRLKWILNSFRLPGVNIKNYQFSDFNKRAAAAELRCDFVSISYASAGGGRMFVNPNLAERFTSLLPDMDKRNSPIRFGLPDETIDSIVIKIPAGFAIEAMPSTVDIKTEFGQFHAKTIRVNEDRLLYVRRFEISVYETSGDKYKELRKFFADIVKADRSQIVLVEKK